MAATEIISDFLFIYSLMLICQIDCFSVSAFAGDVKIEPHAASADLRAKSDVVPEVGSDFDNMQAFATDDRFRRVVIGPVDARKTTS